MHVIDSLDLRIAQRKVQDYHDQLMSEHHSAMVCRDCEDHLALGLRAYMWLLRADEAIHEASREGMIEFTPELKAAIESLYRMWLSPCQNVFTSIASVMEAGYKPENLDEFLEIHKKARMRAIALQMPTAGDLDLIVIDTPAEWRQEGSWIP